MKRKIIIFATIAICACFAAGLFSACNSCNVADEPQAASALRFIDAPESLVIGETRTLIYVFDGDSEDSVKFTSSDTEIAVVDGTAQL